MGALLSSYRKHDAVIMVCQNNARKQIEISAVNDVAERILGYSKEELAQKPLSQVIPARLDETIQENVEYSDLAADLSEVLKKVRNFSIRNSKGQEVSYNFKIVRCEPMDHNPWFQIVLIDEAAHQQRVAFRNVLHENFKGHEVIHDKTGLPDRGSLLKDLQLTLYHANSKEVQAAFGVLEIDKYEEFVKKHGEENGLLLHRHIASIAKQSLRFGDTIATLDPCNLGIILIETDIGGARMVFNRLRWTATNSNFRLISGEAVTFTASLVYCQVMGNVSETDILEKCEGYLKDQRKNVNYAGNTLHEVVAADRREKSTDRRQKAQKVEVERRRGDRRSESGEPL